MSEALPSLYNIPSLPRRYEDTKPALNQVYTHMSILDIGDKISTETLKQFEEEKQAALRQCEEENWEKAQFYTEQRVEDALVDERVKTEKKIKKLQKEHEKNLRKEIARVEEVMQHMCIEKLNEEKAAGEKKLNDLVAKLYANFAIEKKEEIERTRMEEKAIAQEERNNLRKQCDEAMMQQHKRDEEIALLKREELRSQLENEKNEAIKATVTKEQKSAKEYLMQEQRHYDSIIKNLTNILQKEQMAKKETEDKLKEMTDLKNACATELREKHKAFVAFAENRPGFSRGQADYLIPSIPLDFEVGDQ